MGKFQLFFFSARDQRPLLIDKNEKVCTLCSPPIRANGTNTNGRIWFPALFFTIPHNRAFVASYDLLIGLFAFVRVWPKWCFTVKPQIPTSVKGLRILKVDARYIAGFPLCLKPFFDFREATYKGIRHLFLLNCWAIQAWGNFLRTLEKFLERRRRVLFAPLECS